MVDIFYDRKIQLEEHVLDEIYSKPKIREFKDKLEKYVLDEDLDTDLIKTMYATVNAENVKKYKRAFRKHKNTQRLKEIVYKMLTYLLVKTEDDQYMDLLNELNDENCLEIYETIEPIYRDLKQTIKAKEDCLTFFVILLIFCVMVVMTVILLTGGKDGGLLIWY